MIGTKERSYRGIVRSLFCIGLVTLIFLTGVVAPLPQVAAQASWAWHGEYYNGMIPAGAPALLREDTNVSFDWGWGSPGPGVNADQFSARWTKWAYFATGNYTFHLRSDDGVRLWVDEQLIIDQWHDHSATTYSAAKYLGAGNHSLRVEYYENGAQAVCQLWWDGGAGPITEWRGEYYNNTWLGDAPGIVRNDSAINFDWGHGAADPVLNADYFSVRWTRAVYFDSSTNYTFYATVDDGVRLWVDGAILIDKWFPQSHTTHSGVVYLAAGTHQVKVEYFEQTGVAECKVSWTGGTGGTSGPEIIVDDRDAGFIWGGPTGSFYGRSTGYRGHLFWTWNGSSRLYNWAKWFPYVSSAGNYEVYVYIASRYFGTKNAQYKITRNGVETSRWVNQNNYYDQWVSLGTYYFGGGSGEYVFLGDNTGEAYATRFVGFDAMKFVKRDGYVPPSPPGPPPPSGCSITPILGFGRVWTNYTHVRAKLGCPTAVEQGIWGAEEAFWGGLMLWRQSPNYIYALYNNGTWQGYSDTWATGQMEWDPALVPPAGYYQPKRGFGKVWRDNPAVRSGLGWATTEEYGFFGSVQAFNGGTLFWSPSRGIFALYNDGTWERFW